MSQEKEMMEVPVEQFETLVLALEERDKDLEILQDTIISIMRILGLVDKNGQIDPGYADGTKNIFKPIFKEVTVIGADLSVIMVGLPGAKKKEAELAEKFKMMKIAFPIIQKYHKLKQEKNQLASGKHPKQLPHGNS